MRHTEWTSRTELLFGADKMQLLSHAHILIVGIGGVGSYATEMLCRAGIGEMTIIDADTIQPSNINRQLPATHDTIGLLKTEVMATRLLSINPNLKLHTIPRYLKEEDVAPLLDATRYTFIIDAIDTIAPKCSLIIEAYKRNIPIICSMGAGAKTDITQIRFASIWDTYHCGLSKAVRTRLKKAGFRHHLPVVFSTEQANRSAIITIVNEPNKKSTTGTVSYMPAVFGCYLAEYVIQKI